MKFLFQAILAVGLLSPALASDYPLKPSDDAYVSLNECMYALSKGTRLGGLADDIFVYNNELWQISYSSANTQIECEKLGVFSE